MITARPSPAAFVCFAASLIAFGLGAGCGKNRIERALDSDANGYICTSCTARFYTGRDVFAGHCPQCKQPNIQQVVGYVCASDQQVTLGMRGRGSVTCSKCGKPAGGLAIPREADFKAWGAQKKTAEEVGG